MEISRPETPTTGSPIPVIVDRIRALRNFAGALASGIVIAFVISACAMERPGGDADVDEASGSGANDPTTTIVFRQFSSGPSLARAQGSSNPESSDYGALRIFMERAEARTAALGPGKRVVFSLAAGPEALADVAENSYAAAHVSGGSLNSVWGFLYNSVPFGPSFQQMVDFLHNGGGVELVNRIFRERGVDVIAFPVVGSPPQGSGYFKKPVGVPACPESGDAQCDRYADGIGLSGLCAESWTLRYLPPAQTIADRACDGFDSPQQLEFIQAIPGGGALLTAVQQGVVDGFEFATPLDDFDARTGGFFANPEVPEGSDGRNAGEVGLRFLHYPAWHQPFFLGWMVINRSQVWDSLDPDQQAAIEAAAREAVVESFNASSSIECEALQGILDINDGKNQRGANGEVLDASADMIPTRWKSEDLDRLRAAALQVLESIGGGPSAAGSEADYRTIMTALYEHLGYASIADMLNGWSEAAAPAPGGCSQVL